jgi:pimeloyl-ACP methyl ester carboxylesterase
VNQTRPAFVYFHGTPGTSEELTLVTDENWLNNIRIVLPDRDGQFAGDFDAMSTSLKARFSGARLHLVGFSMGGFVALQVASRLGPMVDRIDLVSAAAPLELGDFLPAMAGKHLFAAAIRSPLRFQFLVRAQAFLSAFAPALLHRALFKNVPHAEQKLAADPGFETTINRMTRASLFRNRLSYTREILAYVKPWSMVLPQIHAKTYLWHGADDTWTPVSMAHALAAALPNVVAVNIMPGRAHYSCLIEALPQIAADRHV